MGLRKYILFTFMLLVIICLYIVTLQLGEYSLVEFGLTLTLPISIWMILPMVLLLVVTILHMLFYGFKSYLNMRSYQKDEKNLLTCVKDNFLEHNNNKSFKTEGFKTIANILSQMRLVLKTDTFSSADAKIEKIVLRIKEINDGNYVSDKTISFNKNGLVTGANLLNKINSEIDFAIDILKKPSSYSSKHIKLAFLNVLKEKSMTTVKKLLEAISLDKDMLMALMEKDSDDKQFSISQEELVKYILKADFSKEDYIKVAKMYKKSTNPDELIKMFESLMTSSDEATSAYLYVLFEFEMLDSVREILNTSPANEYTAYRALIDLKENGRNYTIDSLCYS